MSFTLGGATSWGISESQRVSVCWEFDVLDGYREGRSWAAAQPTWPSDLWTESDDCWTYTEHAGLSGLTGKVDGVISRGQYYGFGIHGIETGHLPIPRNTYEGLLDHLKSKQDQGKAWVTTVMQAHKYTEERLDNSNVDVISTSDSEIKLSLTSDADPEYYDYPLTLRTEVPDSWSYCKVSQSDVTYQQIVEVESGIAQYGAVPNYGDVILTESDMDESAPENFNISSYGSADGSEVHADWDDVVDNESGIKRYWYKLGTSKGGDDIYTWIDNGTQSSFSTSRNNLDLDNGETYYITIKAVNGVGLSREVESEGFEVGDDVEVSAPNPIAQKMNIAPKAVSSVEMYSCNGRRIAERKQQLNVNNLKNLNRGAGVYVTRTHLKNGSVITKPSLMAK
jgi:hypothetical protein